MEPPGLQLSEVCRRGGDVKCLSVLKQVVWPEAAMLGIESERCETHMSHSSWERGEFYIWWGLSLLALQYKRYLIWQALCLWYGTASCMTRAVCFRAVIIIFERKVFQSIMANSQTQLKQLLNKGWGKKNERRLWRSKWGKEKRIYIMSKKSKNSIFARGEE